MPETAQAASGMEAARRIRDAQHALTDHLAAERPDAKSVA
jgi:hypothetical protein